MSRIYCLLALVLMTACTKQVVAPTPVETPVATPAPQPVPTPTPAPAPTVPVRSIDEIVVKSSCASYSWKQRGKAPIGYMKGMAKSYARSLCRMNPVMAQEIGDPYEDAMAHYKMSASSPQERIKKLYTLLIGLGMRESSGFYGEGRDMSADNVEVDTAETGLFQFSYNLNGSSPALDAIYKEYKKNEGKCLLDVFKEGIRRSPEDDFYGSGEGRYFQELTRRCPAFAAEYTAIGARVNRRHWGPINRRETEYRLECEAMLTEVEKTVTCK